MFTLLFIVAISIVLFYAGVCVGIWDCKRRFAIPKTAVGVDENGYIYP